MNRGTDFVLCPKCAEWLERLDRVTKAYEAELDRRCFYCNKNRYEIPHNKVFVKGKWYDYPLWRNDIDMKDKFVCPACYEARYHNCYKINFLGRGIRLDHIPRIGVCNWCRNVVPFDTTRTHMHHDDNQYDLEYPARFTIEICQGCHSRETILLRQQVKLVTIFNND